MRGREDSGRLPWCPEQGTDGRDGEMGGWVDTQGSAPLLPLPCSPCTVHLGLCSWGWGGVLTGLGAPGSSPVSPSAPALGLGWGCVPWSSRQECGAGGGKGFTQCQVLTLSLHPGVTPHCADVLVSCFISANFWGHLRVFKLVF